MDIIQAEYEKKIIRFAEKLLLKKLHTSHALIHDDLIHAGNPVVRQLYKMLLLTSKNVKERYQKETIEHLGGLSLWILYKDTAYKDEFFFILYMLLKNADKILPLMEEYVKNPEDWYVNMWNTTKERTAELRRKGMIPETEMSEEEKIFTPVIQARRMKKLVGEK